MKTLSPIIPMESTHHPIDHIIAITLALATCLIRNLKQCLTPTPNTPAATQRLAPSDTGSTNTTTRKSGVRKSSASTSTKRGSTTVAQKKVAGGSKQAARKPVTTSSPRSKRSSGQSNSRKSTILPTNQTSLTPIAPLQLTSDSATKQLKPIQLSDLSTNDHQDNSIKAHAVAS